MSAISTAFRAFFGALFDAEKRTRLEQALDGAVLTEQKPAPEVAKPAKPAAPRRSEALTLLAAMQREARFVDFIQEPIAEYNDAQIGAAVRDIHRDCAALLSRLFDLQPLLAESEGAAVEVPRGYDAARYNLTGNVSGEPPFRGTLAHHGWIARRCELPSWTGSAEGATVVAAATIEIT
jgi:Domain of unknown function (DUF2760)